MNDDRIDIAELRSRLESSREALTSVAETSANSVRPVALDQARAGRVSRVDALQQQAMAQELRRRRHLELQRIEAALKRIDDGEYGWCLRCGEGIGARRLTADPTTPLCIDCAKARDGAR